MKINEVFYKYKNAQDFKNGLYDSINAHETLDIIANELSLQLSKKENFEEIKELIFSCPTYPPFVFCSKLYPKEFYEYFKEKDNHSFNILLEFLIDKMIYNNSETIGEVIMTYDLLDNVDVTCKDTFYSNKIWAIYNYNFSMFGLLVSKARTYFSLYKYEISTLKEIDDIRFIDTFWALFSNSKTYHFKVRLIKELYRLLNSEFESDIQLIIDAGINSSDSTITALKKEFITLEVMSKIINRTI